ncbi:MAG: ATP-binding cassette domain-containing protein [Gammaproteobacteria bacterium]|nr:ATP-binding cassette domain-containing protein [Gammaproteobacteria bacterium]
MKPLVLRDVTLRIDGSALFPPLSLEAQPGTVTSVVGPSGSGKSSLLNYLCGFVPSGITAAGSVLIGKDDLTALPPQARGLGKLFQDPLLFPHLDVAGNLLFGLLGGSSRRERRKRVDDALSSVGLEGFGARDPATLSGGQQARVALLRVLLSEPRALLLDEPFRALDDASRERVRKLVFTEATRRSLPTLLVTHDQGDVAAAAGPVVELDVSA